jgi:hypothetical protein
MGEPLGLQRHDLPWLHYKPRQPLFSTDRDSLTDANIALIYVGLGDADEAMSWLNRAYEARFNASILLRLGFDPLRSDARFRDLLRRIGLPQ